jgi:putative membrane protein insertion efficiency factor
MAEVRPSTPNPAPPSGLASPGLASMGRNPIGGVLRALRRVDELLAWPFRGLVFLYRLLLSRHLPPACRFEPSCSAYAAEALARCGAVRGLALTARRLGRCHPWGGEGWDPVPPCRCTPLTHAHARDPS